MKIFISAAERTPTPAVRRRRKVRPVPWPRPLTRSHRVVGRLGVALVGAGLARWSCRGSTRCARARPTRSGAVVARPRLAGVRHRRPGRARAAVRRRAGRPDRRRRERQGAAASRSSTSAGRSRPGASRASSASPSRPTTRRAASSSSTTRTRAATPVSSATGRTAAGRSPGRRRARCWRSRSRTRTTTAGMVAFGPDGLLYVGMGDGGSGGDPENRSQSPRSLLGKMLRLDARKPGAKPDDRRSRRPQPVALLVRPRRPATSGSATSARARSRRSRGSRRARPGCSTSAGTSTRAARTYEDKEPGPGPPGRPGRAVLARRGLQHHRRLRRARRRAEPPVGRYVFGDYCAGTIWSMPGAAAPIRRRGWSPSQVDDLVSFGEDLGGRLLRRLEQRRRLPRLLRRALGRYGCACTRGVRGRRRRGDSLVHWHALGGVAQLVRAAES